MKHPLGSMRQDSGGVLGGDYLPGQRYFYWHGHDFGQQAAVESRHEGSGVVVREDQRHLQAEEDRGALRFTPRDTGNVCIFEKTGD